MKQFYILFVLACASHVQAADLVSESQINRGISWIDNCIDRYQEIAQTQLSSDIDRAYVLVYEHDLAVLFSHGEVGTFGPRSLDYYSVLGCEGSDRDRHEILFMAETLKEPLIEDRDLLDGFYRRTSIAEAKSEAMELLFMRGSSGFAFSKGQVLSDDNIDKHNDSEEAQRQRDYLTIQ